MGNAFVVLSNKCKAVRFEILTAVDYEDCCLCILMPCILLDSISGTWCVHHIFTLLRQQVLLK